MSAFEHNCKCAMTNQVFPAELKLPNRLHGYYKNVLKYPIVFKWLIFQMKQTRSPTAVFSC